MMGPSLCWILTLLQEEGPALGIIINLPKCEVFSRHGLDMFPLGIKKSNKSNMETHWRPGFCSSFISKHSRAKILLLQLEEVGVSDPQVALILYGAMCKPVHLARATPSTLTYKAFALSIASQLNPVILLEADVSATAAAQATESRKHQANDPKCLDLG